MRKQVRKLRHWKQRWNKNADFIWRRAIRYAGKMTVPGDPIPQALKEAPTKLRRFWESQTIELAEFVDPNVATGQVKDSLSQAEPTGDEIEVDPPIEGVTVVKAKGSWFVVNTGDDEVKVNGQKALDALLDELRTERSEDETDNDEAETSEDDDERAREDDGTYKADDPDTPDVNEAWEDGEGPKADDDDFLS